MKKKIFAEGKKKINKRKKNRMSDFLIPIFFLYLFNFFALISIYYLPCEIRVCAISVIIHSKKNDRRRRKMARFFRQFVFASTFFLFVTRHVYLSVSIL